MTHIGKAAIDGDGGILFERILQTVFGEFSGAFIFQPASGESVRKKAQTSSLNYARVYWTQAGENPPVGLILCAQKDAAAHYALEGLPNKVLAAAYRTTLPDEKTLATELERTRRVLEQRVSIAEKRKKP